MRINTYNPLRSLRIDWPLSMSMQPFVNLASVSLVGRKPTINHKKKMQFAS